MHNRILGPTMVALLTLAGVQSLLLPGAHAQTIHLVLACEPNDPNIHKAMDLARLNIRKLFADNVPQQQLKIVEVSPEQFSADEIVGTVAKARVQAEDTLVFVYCGHGAFDQTDDETHLTPKQDSTHLPLSTLIKALHARKPKLAVAILDCCNVLRPLAGQPRKFIPREVAAYSALTEMTPLFRSLFVDPTGEIIIESSSKGEYAVVKPRLEHSDKPGDVTHQSTLFSDCWIEAMSPKRSPTNWPTVCDRTQTAMDREFKSVCPDNILHLSQ